MGVYYSASLSYGYALPELDQDDYPDGVEELSFSDGITYSTIGDSYSGISTKIVGPREYSYEVDIPSGPFRAFDIATPDAEQVKERLHKFFTDNELDPPEGEPQWHFGGHVY